MNVHTQTTFHEAFQEKVVAVNKVSLSACRCRITGRLAGVLVRLYFGSVSFLLRTAS
jgi:hypothetical protein